MRLFGTVRYFDSGKGFGRIQPDRCDKEVLVHATALDVAHIDSLKEGDRVSFELEDDKCGHDKQAGHLERA